MFFLWALNMPPYQIYFFKVVYVDRIPGVKKTDQVIYMVFWKE